MKWYGLLPLSRKQMAPEREWDSSSPSSAIEGKLIRAIRHGWKPLRSTKVGYVSTTLPSASLGANVKERFDWDDVDDVRGYDASVALVMFLGKLKILRIAGYGSSRRNGIVIDRWITIGKRM